MWDIIITRKNDINFAAQYWQGGAGNIEIIQYDNIIKIIDQEFLQLFSMFSAIPTFNKFQRNIFIKDIMSLRKVIIYFKNVYSDIVIQKQPVR